MGSRPIDCGTREGWDGGRVGCGAAAWARAWCTTLFDPAPAREDNNRSTRIDVRQPGRQARLATPASHLTLSIHPAIQQATQAASQQRGPAASPRPPASRASQPGQPYAYLVSELPHVTQPGAQRSGGGAPHARVPVVPCLPVGRVGGLQHGQARASSAGGSNEGQGGRRAGRQASTARHSRLRPEESRGRCPGHGLAAGSAAPRPPPAHPDGRLARGPAPQVQRPLLRRHLQRGGGGAHGGSPRGRVQRMQASNDAEHVGYRPLCRKNQSCSGGSAGLGVGQGRQEERSAQGSEGEGASMAEAQPARLPAPEPSGHAAPHLRAALADG